MNETINKTTNQDITTELAAQAKLVRDYITFNGQPGLDLDETEQGVLQSKGVAALWHRIEEDNFAYLADEVGMGKTRQAMGVIATLFLHKPNARVVVICPGKPLQSQWQAEWVTFVNDCLRVTDGILKSPLDDKIAMPMALHERLNAFAKSLLLDDKRIHLLRYSSFSRPIGFHSAKEVEDVKSKYQKELKAIGIGKLNDEEKLILENAGEIEDCRAALTKALNTCYADRIKILLRSEARPIDLIVCDEAQYLRHVGNMRNRNIKTSLGSVQCKWLFLSATPLHSGANDIKSLDTYLCSHVRHEGICKEDKNHNIRTRMEGSYDDKDPVDVVDILDDFLVRRPRQYIDAKDNKYDKVAYRRYETDGAQASDDAFASMVTALVQKHLVKRLAGKNNKFRQGECSSFESLASSAGNNSYKNCDGVDIIPTELENDKSGATTQETPDRMDIDLLNNSLRDAMVKNELIKKADAGQYHLPHTKLYHVVDNLTKNCLKNAPNHKTLVFVRRLDTVVELMVLLQQKFQKVIDKRIDDWSDWLKKSYGSEQVLGNHGSFWASKDKQPKDDEPVEEVGDDEEDNGALSRAAQLPYFKAISQKTGERGLLASFMSNLLQKPLAFLVCDDDADSTHCKNPDWEAFVAVIYDVQPDIEKHKKIFDEANTNDIKALKRCLLQSMRRSDFIVDLYVLNNFVDIKQLDERTYKSDNDLTTKLIWLLQQAKTDQLSETYPDLNTYLSNWRERLRNWCEHFSLIKQKCFKDQPTTEDINNEFKRMGPVLGRSGSLANKHAVTQFKMPCYPNILVCTDVLKEGVDMHLFCHEVIHYGVAWTSGDLEQRIGRVDRVNSLIHRSMLQHQGPPDTAPTLHAGFPYLGGTLDQHQVNRVIKAKLSSDLRMDFGKREDDIQDISIDDLLSKKANEKPDETQLKTREFLPASLTLVGKSLAPNIQKDLSAPYLQLKNRLDVAKHQQTNITYQSLYPIEVVEVNYEHPAIKSNGAATLGDDIKSKWTHTKKKGKFLWLENVACLVPLDLTVDQATLVVKTLLDKTQIIEPTGITQLNNAKGFKFDSQYKTLAKTQNDHIAPHKQTDNRQQTVIIESIDDWILIRSPIITFEDSHHQGPELAKWIAEKNNRLSFGYLNDHSDIIWFCCLIAHPEKLGEQLNLLIDKIATTADRLQQLYTASDNENWSYQSEKSIKALLPKCENRSDFNALMSSNENLKHDIANWQKLIFVEVINAIADELGISDIKREAAFANLLHSKPFVRHGQSSIEMPEAPTLRFRLINYLDFNDNHFPHLPQGFPLMCWELGINTAKMGRPPQLELDTWQTLPHNPKGETEPEWMRIKSPNNTQVYTWQDRYEPNRWLALYHPALLLEGRTDALVCAWKSVARRMRHNDNFTREACARDLGIFG